MKGHGWLWVLPLITIQTVLLHYGGYDLPAPSILFSATAKSSSRPQPRGFLKLFCQLKMPGTGGFLHAMHVFYHWPMASTLYFYHLFLKCSTFSTTQNSIWLTLLASKPLFSCFSCILYIFLISQECLSKAHLNAPLWVIGRTRLLYGLFDQGLIPKHNYSD